ncbi:MAG: ATP-binding cassette domain-containing protein [Planctomycetota bacterium]|jgi:ABC-type multidrug transport system ATPase subunit
MPRALWKLEDVTLAGDAGRPRLAGVSLEILEGTTAVVGPSGAGKTSLLNVLVGYERPDSGAIVFGLAQSDAAGSERALRFALPLFWVPQRGGLWPHLTALGHLGTVAPGRDADELRALLAEFDIDSRAEARPDQLSEGECSRLAVARALAADPAVLVMDEPLANVDPARVGGYWDVVRGRASERGAAMVFATHSPETVMREAERAVCVREGRVLYAGDVEPLYFRPATEELARCLGEANWLSPRDAREWLGRDEAEARCFRPQEIAVRPDEDGPLVVRSSRFQGSVAEVELERAGTGERRRFFHRPSPTSMVDGLGAGTRVSIKAVIKSALKGALSLLVAAAITVGGCGKRDGGGPELDVKSWRAWQMPPDGARVPAPREVEVGPGGEVLVLDTSGRVLIFDDSGKLARSWRMPETERGRPEGALFLRDGRIAVADTHYHRVIFFDAGGREVGRLGSEGRGDGEFIYPVALAEDDSANLYVCEYGHNDRVQKFSRTGAFVSAFGGAGTGEGEFQRPSGIAWRACAADPRGQSPCAASRAAATSPRRRGGRLYISDAFNNRVQVFSDDGGFVGVLSSDKRPSTLEFPYDLALGGDGALFLIEYKAGRLTKLSPGGELVGTFGSAGTGEGEFRTPWGLAARGGRVYVADTGNRRVVELVFAP